MDLARAAAIMREATKDKSYQMFPMGQEAAAYLRMKRKRLTDSSYRDYERGLDKLARFFPDLELTDFEPPVGTERIEEFLDAQYGGSSPRNYNKNLSILRDFFKFQVVRSHLHGDPTLGIERAKSRQVYRTTFTNDQRRAILAAAESPRDRLALRLLLDYALRKGALQAIQFKHFDRERKQLTIFTKGQKVSAKPIPDPHFWADYDRLRLERAESDYLMWVERTVPAGPVIWMDDHWGRKTRKIPRYDRAMTGKPLHMWWYARLEAAGIVAKGQTSGERMHKARHTAGQRILDATGNIVAVQKQLGHASIQTTADTYTDWDIAQQAATMELVLMEDEKGA